MGEIIVRERMFIPAQYLDERKVKKRYVHRFYDEAACRRCENRPERHNYLCNKCEFYGGKNVTYNEKMIDGDLYYGLPMGDRAKIEDVFGLDFDDFEIDDLRTKAKRRFKVKMVGFTPYSYQEPAVVDLKKAKYGILKAPPRSGKTPTMLYTGVTQFPYRIAIIADQREFLDQFLDHVREYTNLQDLEQKHKMKLFGYGKKPEDFENFEIIVCTYQTFLSNKGKKLFKLLNKNFGTVFCDEVHSGGALEYSKVLNDLWAKIRIGATGTVERKDCVVRGTPVQTSCGSVPIEEIKAGDYVWTYNHESGSVELQEVYELHRRDSSPVVRVTHSNGVIECTPDHEFYTQRGYVKAVQLTPDDVLFHYLPDDE